MVDSTLSTGATGVSGMQELIEDNLDRRLQFCELWLIDLLQTATELISQKDSPHYSLNVRNYLNHSFPRRWIGQRGAMSGRLGHQTQVHKIFFVPAHEKLSLQVTLKFLRARIIDICSEVTSQKITCISVRIVVVSSLSIYLTKTVSFEVKLNRLSHFTNYWFFKASYFLKDWIDFQKLSI